MNIKLVSPLPEYKEDHHLMIQEFLDNNEEIIPGQMKFREGENYKTFILRIQDQKEGKNLKPGRVTTSLYFILNEEPKVVGGISIRHYLNEELSRHGGHIGYGIMPSKRGKGYTTQALKLALEEAKKLGIDKVMLTCDKSNIASARVIEKNGGILDSEYIDEGRMIQKRRIENK